MATPAHTPQGRGYDSWTGYFQHANNYWTKLGHIEATGTMDLCLNRPVDLFIENATYRGGELDPGALDGSCSSSTEDKSCYEDTMFRDRALQVLDDHNVDMPLFYFHSFHLVHSPLNVPSEYMDKTDAKLAAHGLAFDDASRRNYSSMVQALPPVRLNFHSHLGRLSAGVVHGRDRRRHGLEAARTTHVGRHSFDRAE